MKTRAGNTRSIAKSLREYARGVAGGLIFSLPLLYTMEVWSAGVTSHPWRIAVHVVITFFLLLGYNRFAGLRSDAGWGEVMIDSVEEMGIGLIVSAGALWALGQIGLEMGLAEAAGKVVIEGMAVAIGVSVGTATLGVEDGEGREDSGMEGEPSPDEGGNDVMFGAQVMIGFCGAVLFAMNIAPTEEVLLIATNVSHAQVITMMLGSMALGMLILYYIEFTGSGDFVAMDGLGVALGGAVVMYTTALAASALMLWLFGQYDGLAFMTCVWETVVLAVASTLGASAGRLLLQL